MADGSFAFAEAPTPEELASFDMNDLGNAFRLIRLAGGSIDDDGTVDVSASTLLYQIGAGWVGFNGKYWDRTYGEELARRMAHKVAAQVRGLFHELTAASSAPAKEIMAFIKHCGSAGATNAMLRQAQSYLTVEIDVFDQDPMAINCQNGTLKLKVVDKALKRELRPHNPADRITKIAACDYAAQDDAPLFKGVFDFSFQSSKAEAAYFRRCAGYGATGLIREQAFFVCQGKGRDGKSTLLDAMREAMGTYGEVGDVKTFLDGMQSSAGGPAPDMVKLSGDVRFVVLSEPKRGSVWDESRLKAWTSGSPMTTRDLQSKNFNFRPRGKLFVECNPFPKPKGDDDGFWRRIKVVLFRHQVAEEDKDLDLPDKIRAAELSGILNWMLDGLEDYLVNGMKPPSALLEFISNYRSMASPFNDWLDSCCHWGVRAEGQQETSKDLFTSFKEWWEAQGHDSSKMMSMRAFGDALGDRQIMVKKNRLGNKVRFPIKLKTPEEIAAEAERSAVDAPSGAGGQEGSSTSSKIDLPPGDFFEPGSFEPDEGDGQ